VVSTKTDWLHGVLTRLRRVARGLDLVTGSIFIGLGARLAFSP
jgi:threonine/homoserine/homoserine lactone efflux protein